MEPERKREEKEEKTGKRGKERKKRKREEKRGKERGESLLHLPLLIKEKPVKRLQRRL